MNKFRLNDILAYTQPNLSILYKDQLYDLNVFLKIAYKYFKNNISLNQIVDVNNILCNYKNLPTHNEICLDVLFNYIYKNVKKYDNVMFNKSVVTSLTAYAKIGNEKFTTNVNFLWDKILSRYINLNTQNVK